MEACLKSSVHIDLVKKTPLPHFCSTSQILPERRFSPMATLSSTLSSGLSKTFAMAALSSAPAVGLSETFARLNKVGQVAFIPYITAGDPYLATTAEALKVLDSCGSDIIELGIPHSDPLADGPVIRASAARSLARGASFNAILSMLKVVVPQLSCPIVLFSYYKPILEYGVQKFMSAIEAAGVQGLVVPDMPFEKTVSLTEEAVNNNIDLVLLITPTTSSGRMEAIAEASNGFVYLVSSTGVTGIRASVNDKVETLLQQVKEKTSKPVAVGFGLSKPEHVKKVAGWGADGVIVGSAIVKLLGEAHSPEEGLKDMKNFVKSLKSALNPL